jgi:orotidine-5'-phosphate decarboxylase
LKVLRTMSFIEQFLDTARRNRSALCIGLDPDPQRLPPSVRSASDPVLAFCSAIIEATSDLVCAYKPNIAFFEAMGLAGMQTLYRLMAQPRPAPFILDAKRGDMGSTAEAYACAVFEQLQADAVTLNPYQGRDSLEPFLRHADRGCFILCKTSNPTSVELQEQALADGRPLYMEVARLAQEVWNEYGNVGLVVGATYPAALREVRAQCPDMPLLVPGVGAQGGALADAVRASVDAHGERTIVNASRSVLYASDGGDYAEAARAEALRLRDAIQSALQQEATP